MTNSISSTLRYEIGAKEDINEKRLKMNSGHVVSVFAFARASFSTNQMKILIT